MLAVPVNCHFEGFAVVRSFERAQVQAARPGTEISCDRRTGNAFSLDPAVKAPRRRLDPTRRSTVRFDGYRAAGRWLVYRRHGARSELWLRREILSGHTRRLTASRAVGQIRMLRQGSVAFVERTPGGERLVLVPRHGRRQVVARGTRITDVRLTLVDGAPRVSWTGDDGPQTGGPGAPAGPGPTPAPGTQPTPSPGEVASCAAQPAVYAHGRVRVFADADGSTVACDTETGERYILAFAGRSLDDITDAGPFVLYEERVDADAGTLRRLDLRDGGRVALAQVRDGTVAERFALLADGTAAWLTYAPDADATTLQRAAADGTTEEVAFGDGIDRASYRLGPDGTAYWTQDGVERSAPPLPG